MYETYIKKTKRLSHTIDLGKGSYGHWIGDAKADNVLIWYHGQQRTTPLPISDQLTRK